jgi:predicted metal-dependent HD superfamily phosphohydrolase
VADALRTLERIEAAELKKTKPKPTPKDEPASAADDTEQGAAANAKPPKAARVSTTDADARLMKMADGGLRPAFNGQLVVDTATQVITAVALSNAGSDMNQMAPMMHELRRRYGLVPEQWLAVGRSPLLRPLASERLAPHPRSCRA